MKLGVCAAAIDTARRHVQLVDGTRYADEAMLLATGAEPVRIEVPGRDHLHVHERGDIAIHVVAPETVSMVKNETIASLPGFGMAPEGPLSYS